MRRLLTILLLLIYSAVFGQDIKPISPNFKLLPSPSFSYYTTDSSVWIYKGAVYGWTKLARFNDLADTLNYYVPYLNAFKDVNLNTHSLATSGIKFNTISPLVVSNPGDMGWHATEGTVDIRLLNGTTLQLGQEEYFYGKAIEPIPNGYPVMIAGVQGNHTTFKKAVYSELVNYPQKFLGIATQNIATNDFGYVTWFGKVHDTYTTGWAAGDNLYLDPTTSLLTNILPNAPYLVIRIGSVIELATGASENGTIGVRPTFGIRMQDLNDVNGTPLNTSGQFAVWNQTNQYFDFTKNIDDYVDYPVMSAVKEFTGFVSPESVSASYSHTNRTITLSGDLRYMYNGHIKTLTSPWTSSAHTATAGAWFLSSADGTNFTWSQSVWAFSDIQVSYVNYNASNLLSFATKETHGATMDYRTHQNLHNNIGTYRRVSDGGLLTTGTYTIGGATNSETTFGIDQAGVHDEDINHSVALLPKGTYTTMYVNDNLTSVFNTASSYPFIAAASYIQVNNTTTGTLVDGVTLKYYNVYDIIVPTASDGDSQKYRHIFLQPQKTFNNLSNAQSEIVTSLSLGAMNNISPEFVISARITYTTLAANTNYGKCSIAGVSYIYGNNANQTSIAGLSQTNHALLTNRDWIPSLHYSTPNRIASFDATGNASVTEYGDLTENITGLELSAIRQVLGGSATLTVSTGYVIPTTDNISHAETAYTHSQNDADLSATNEIQTLSTDGSAGNVTLSNGGGTININVNDADANASNELNTNLAFDEGNRILSLTDAGGTRTVTISQGNIVNCFMNTFSPSSTTVAVTWPSNFADTNYDLDVKHWWTKTVNGKNIVVNSAVYDFSKTIYGFSCKLDTLAGYITYRAVNSSNLYPISINNYLSLSGGTMSNTNLVGNLNAELLNGHPSSYYATIAALSNYVLTASVTTTVGNPGSDSNIPTEKAVRTALNSAGGGTVTQIIASTGLSGGTITNTGTISVNYGTTSITATIGNDSRLSDTRTPTTSSVSYAKVATDLASSGTVTSTVDLSARSIGTITLSAGTAFIFTGYQLGKSYLLIVTANGFTPSFATSARHVLVTGNETLGTSGVFYINLTCIDATSGSEKLLTTIMKGA